MAPVTPPVTPSKIPLAQRSLIARPAWMRVVAVMPVLLLLWLGVAWASMDVLPW